MSECAKNIMNRLALITRFIAIGAIISLLSHWLRSDFLVKLYGVTLVSVILACTALSFAMYSFIANKLIEIKRQFPWRFQGTNHELHVALKTQISLFGALIVLLICYHSSVIIDGWVFSSLTLETFLNFIIICFIHIMYDMGKTTYYIVVCFDSIMSLDNKDKDTKI